MSEITVKRDDVKVGDVWMSVSDNSMTELLVVDEVLRDSFRVRSNFDGEIYISNHDLITDYDLIIPAKFIGDEPKADMVNHPPHYKDESGVDNTFNDDIALQTFGELPVRKMRLIGITGKARSGKDTTAKYLLNKLGGNWSSASFADPMKAMLNAIGVDTSDEAKDLPSNQYGVSTRHMLQTLGTEWGRNLIADDFWLTVFESMNAGRCLIVPDVRFENEADLIRKHGVLICIEGRGGIESGHISKRKLQYGDRDIYIDNRGSLSELYEKLNSIDFDGE